MEVKDKGRVNKVLVCVKKKKRKKDKGRVVNST